MARVIVAFLDFVHALDQFGRLAELPDDPVSASPNGRRA
jgi:hypothetical protein